MKMQLRQAIYKTKVILKKPLSGSSETLFINVTEVKLVNINHPPSSACNAEVSNFSSSGQSRVEPSVKEDTNCVFYVSC